LDVSVKETIVCVIDGCGKTIREVKVANEPELIVAILTDETFTIKRISLEAGPLSQWLYSGLAEAGLPVICVETRHMKAVLSAQLNKSDRNDTRPNRRHSVISSFGRVSANLRPMTARVSILQSHCGLDELWV
jgi:transposase